MKCPGKAITTPRDWPELKLFESYNVRKTFNNPAAEYVLAKHSKGRIEIL